MPSQQLHIHAVAAASHPYRRSGFASMPSQRLRIHAVAAASHPCRRGSFASMPSQQLHISRVDRLDDDFFTLNASRPVCSEKIF
jgi:hypothetical protein